MVFFFFNETKWRLHHNLTLLTLKCTKSHQPFSERGVHLSRRRQILCGSGPIDVFLAETIENILHCVFMFVSSHCVVLSGFSASKVQAGEPHSFLLISLLFVYWNLRLEADTVDANPSEPKCFQSACAALPESSSHWILYSNDIKLILPTLLECIFPLGWMYSHKLVILIFFWTGMQLLTQISLSKYWLKGLWHSDPSWGCGQKFKVCQDSRCRHMKWSINAGYVYSICSNNILKT